MQKKVFKNWLFGLTSGPETERDLADVTDKTVNHNDEW